MQSDIAATGITTAFNGGVTGETFGRAVSGEHHEIGSVRTSTERFTTATVLTINPRCLIRTTNAPNTAPIDRCYLVAGFIVPVVIRDNDNGGGSPLYMIRG
jgi:hypothetical protein